MTKQTSVRFAATAICVFISSSAGSSAEPDAADYDDEPDLYDDGGGTAEDSVPPPGTWVNTGYQGAPPTAAVSGAAISGPVDLDRDEPSPDASAPTVADPVILATGELIHAETDLHLLGPGIASLEFHRTYRSRSDLRSSLGSNWFHNHDIRVLWGRGAVKASLPGACGTVDDTCVVLRREGVDSIYLRPPGSSFYASFNGDGSMIHVAHEVVSGRPSLATLSFPDGAKMLFDDSGYVFWAIDRFLNQLMYEYTSTELDNAWDRLCRHDDTYPVAAGFARRVCDTLHVALGERTPMVTDVDMADRTAPSTFTMNNAESAVFERLDVAALLSPAYIAGYCQADYCTPSYFDMRQSNHVHMPDTPVDGGQRRRLTKVRDHLGRSLNFTYVPWTEPNAGLLASVTGPSAGAVSLTFTYASPDDSMIEGYRSRLDTTTVHTGEWFLTSASRRGTVAGATEARRDVRYVYSWQRTSNRLSLVEHFTSHVNRLDRAGLQNQPIQAVMEIRRLRSAVIDNMTEVYANDFDVVGERLVVRSQYDENANFHLGTPTSVFDRVIGQYYGGSTHVGAARVAGIVPFVVETRRGDPVKSYAFTALAAIVVEASLARSAFTSCGIPS